VSGEQVQYRRLARTIRASENRQRSTEINLNVPELSPVSQFELVEVYAQESLLPLVPNGTHRKMESHPQLAGTNSSSARWRLSDPPLELLSQKTSLSVFTKIHVEFNFHGLFGNNASTPSL
jgi:hypothetical protein